ncbi:MAG TPA: 3-dehydroquinate synthase [Gemmatimonadaceae bacterium]|nr:3-dehydroquinate synthase [Gemmatimonadaceae bacterium]
MTLDAPLRELAPLGYPIVVGGNDGVDARASDANAERMPAGATSTAAASAGTLDALMSIINRVAPAHTLVVIADATVERLHGARLRRALAADTTAPARIVELTVMPGEASKNRDEWARLTDAMLDAGCGRDTTVVAFGGGMVGDLAGFVAATYMRGVPVVQLPTTLLAMVDASVGGKTAIDTPHGKNLVGAFHQPAAVLADLTMLQTLPPRDLRSGMAEVIKHGVIASEAHLAQAGELLPRYLAGDATAREPMAELVADSIAIKGGVVSRDEREQGERRILNFGHTIGHAVETASRFALLHGEAVAIGMCAEAALAERLGVGAPGVADRVRRAVLAVGLPTAIPGELASNALLELMRTDKKMRAGRLLFALPRSIGAMANAHDGWAVTAEESDVLTALDEAR